MHLDSRRPQQVLTFNGKYDTMNSEAELFPTASPWRGEYRRLSDGILATGPLLFGDRLSASTKSQLHLAHYHTRKTMLNAFRHNNLGHTSPQSCKGRV